VLPTEAESSLFVLRLSASHTGPEPVNRFLRVKLWTFTGGTGNPLTKFGSGLIDSLAPRAKEEAKTLFLGIRTVA
jgi:hypothetical protein